MTVFGPLREGVVKPPEPLSKNTFWKKWTKQLATKI